MMVRVVRDVVEMDVWEVAEGMMDASGGTKGRNASDESLMGDTISSVFFFQAEDGIRDIVVTGVQTCALPICPRQGSPGRARTPLVPSVPGLPPRIRHGRRGRWEHERGDRAGPSRSGAPCAADDLEIGRASCRERV